MQPDGAAVHHDPPPGWTVSRWTQGEGEEHRSEWMTITAAELDLRKRYLGFGDEDERRIVAVDFDGKAVDFAHKHAPGAE